MTAAARFDRADLQECYARETRQRMGRAMAGIQPIQQAEIGGIFHVLEQLRLQEEVSRLMGFQGIARLCRDLEDYLTAARDDEAACLPEVAATLSGVCRAIRLHAETFDRRLPCPGDSAARGTRAADVTHSMPPAPLLAQTVIQEGEHGGKS